jgi:arabinogalactan oligomer/maltooligosaccharide transport system substrate-binding protein
MDTRIKKLTLILILMITSFGAGIAVKADPCVTDGLTVCFVAQKNAYKIEAHARLSILVPNSAYGQAIVDYWDWYHPEAAGIVTYEVVSSTSGSQDVLFITQVQAGALFQTLYPLDENLSKNVDIEKVYALNAKSLTYLPISADGFAFLVNKTRLEEAGLSTQDQNSDGLIDSIDSFEKIIALKTTWESQQVNVFPIPLNEPYSFYPFLTAGGFSLFDSYDALKPGFDTEAFKTGLSFVKSLSEINWNHSELNKAETYPWKLDDALIKDDFVFTLAGPWMDISANDLQTPSEWVVSKFPSYLGNELTPMIKTSGFAINGNTLYPSAAHELIRILKSIKGIQLLVDNTTLTPLVNDALLQFLTFEDPHRKELAMAYRTSVSEPIIAFPDNPSTLAIQTLYRMKFMSTIQALWDGTLSVEEAQTQMVDEATRVIAELNTPEVVNQ